MFEIGVGIKILKTVEKRLRGKCCTRLVRASDQSTIDRQGILMQILLVAGLKIVLFTSKFHECS